MGITINNSNGEIFRTQVPIAGEYCVAYDGANVVVHDQYWYSQGFTVGTTGSNVRQNPLIIYLKLARINVPSGSVTVSIRSSQSGPDLTSGSLLTTDIAVLNYYAFTMTQNITLENGGVYYIVLRCLSGSTVDYIGWYGIGTNAYTGGVYSTSTDSGATWTPSALDLDFKVISAQPQTGIITKISEKKVSRTVVHDLPSADFDIIQKMGRKNRTFSLAGECYTSSGSAWIRALPSTTGSISYTTALGTEFLPQTNVLFTNIDFQDVGGRPLERKLSLDAVEII